MVMPIVADVSIVPIGEGTSLSKYVKKAIEELKKSGVRVELGAMSTTLEADDVAKIFDAVQMAREALFDMGVKRVYTILRIDERKDKPISIETKLGAVK